MSRARSNASWPMIASRSAWWVKLYQRRPPRLIRGSSTNLSRSAISFMAAFPLFRLWTTVQATAKAAARQADEVVFDLEDGCAPSQKLSARKTLIEAFSTLDFRGKIRAFRPNGIETKFFYRDVIEVVEAAGSRIDVIVLPKIQ